MNLKKDIAIIGGLFLLVAGLLVFGRNFTTIGQLTPPRRESTQSATTSQRRPTEEGRANVAIKELGIVAEVANTKDERAKGLSGRDSLPISEGVLFVFEKSGKYGIWMKEMRFPIDIIWIDEGKKIADIVANALPEPDKNDEELTIYRPKTEALYILEINAGLSTLNNLQIGEEVNFEL